MDFNANYDDIFRRLAPGFKRIYESFKYIDISFEEYTDFVLDKISKMELPRDYQDYVLEEINMMMDNITKELLLGDSSFRIISNYIDGMLKDISSYEDAIDAFKDLDFLFKKYGIVIDQKVLLELINKNSKLGLMVDYILKEKKTEIVNGNADSLFENDFLALTVRFYCDLKNIKIKEDKNIGVEDFSSYSSADLDIVKLYLKEISCFPMLTALEEKELALRIASGDEKAKEQFINSNLRLVISVAKKFKNKDMSFLDLIQEGNFGLMKAVERFDVSKGCRFSTYAVYYIKAYISKAVDDQARTIRIPIYKNEEMRAYARSVLALEMEYGRELKVNEIALALGKKVEDIIKLESLRQGKPMSLNSLINDDSDSEYGDFVPALEVPVEEKAILETLVLQVKDLLKSCDLSEQAIDVLLSRNGIDRDHIWTLEELAKKYGVSRAWIGQLEARSLRKLRNCKNIESFAVYMEDPEAALKRLDEFRIKPAKKKKVKTGRRGSKLKTIYEYFSDYSREEIDYVLNGLDDFDKELIYTRYGPDLDNPVSGNFGEKETVKFYNSLIPRIRKKLDRVKFVDKAEIKQCKDDFTFTYSSIPMFSDVSTVDKLSKDDYVKLIELLKTPDFSELFSDLSSDEAIILSLRLGYFEGKCYSVDAISDFLGLSTSDIRKKTRDVFKNHADKVDAFLDKAITTSSSDNSSKVLLKTNSNEILSNN